MDPPKPLEPTTLKKHSQPKKMNGGPISQTPNQLSIPKQGIKTKASIDNSETDNPSKKKSPMIQTKSPMIQKSSPMIQKKSPMISK